LDILNEGYLMKINCKQVVDLYSYCDYIPVVSTLTNLTEIFIKLVIRSSDLIDLKDNHYFLHLKHKDFKRCAILLIPVFGNIIYIIQDFRNRDYNNKATVLKKMKLDNSVYLKSGWEIRNDREVALGYLKDNILGMVLMDLGVLLKHDREFMLQVVKDFSQTFIFLIDEFKVDKEFILSCVTSNPNLLRLTGDFRKDRDVVFTSVKLNALTFSHADITLRNDPELAFLAYNSKRSTAEHFGEELKKNTEFNLKLAEYDRSWLSNLNNHCKDDKKFMLRLVKSDGLALQHGSNEFRRDREIVLEAVTQNGLALNFAKKDLDDDVEIKLASVRQNGAALQFVRKQDLDTVLEAVKNDGMAYQHCTGEFRDNEVIRAAALKQNQLAAKFMKKNLILPK